MFKQLLTKIFQTRKNLTASSTIEPKQLGLLDMATKSVFAFARDVDRVVTDRETKLDLATARRIKAFARARANNGSKAGSIWHG